MNITTTTSFIVIDGIHSLAKGTFNITKTQSSVFIKTLSGQVIYELFEHDTTINNNVLSLDDIYVFLLENSGLSFSSNGGGEAVLWDLQKVLSEGSVAEIENILSIIATVFEYKSNNFNLSTGSKINFNPGATMELTGGVTMRLGMTQVSNEDILIDSNGFIVAAGSDLSNLGASSGTNFLIKVRGGLLQMRSGTQFMDDNGTLILKTYNQNGLIIDANGLRFQWTDPEGNIENNFYKFPANRGVVGQVLTQESNGTVSWKDTIPKPPVEGNYILKSTNGVMSWVEEV